MNNNVKAGKIVGNPLCGMCERMGVSVKRILDGCKRNWVNQQFSYALSDFSPQAPTYPYVFERLISSGQTVINALTVQRYDDVCSRVRLIAQTPILVTFTDSNNNLFSARSSLTLQREVLLKVPISQYEPYSIEVATNVSSTVGAFDSFNTLRASTCIVQIIRVVTSADILIPTYGAIVYPSCCEDFQDDFCGGISQDPQFFSG